MREGEKEQSDWAPPPPLFAFAPFRRCVGSNDAAQAVVRTTLSHIQGLKIHFESGARRGKRYLRRNAVSAPWAWPLPAALHRLLP